MEGYVYVLSNNWMDGMLRVGVGARNPNEAARYLSADRPSPFILEYCLKSEAYEAIGQKARALLTGFYVGRELYRCDLQSCVRGIKQAAREHLPYKEWHRDRELQARIDADEKDCSASGRRYAGTVSVEREQAGPPQAEPDRNAGQSRAGDEAASGDGNGYVYVLSNKAMPGLFKVGCTSHDPEKRAEALNTTGVPVPFAVEYSIKISGYQAVERRAHEILDDRNFGKEFFECDLEACIRAIKRAAFERLSCTEWYRDQMLRDRMDGKG